MVISFLVGGLSFDKVLLSYQLGYSCCYCDSDVDKVGGGRALQNNSKVIIIFFFWHVAFKSAVVGNREASESQGHRGRGERMR